MIGRPGHQCHLVPLGHGWLLVSAWGANNKCCGMDLFCGIGFDAAVLGPNTAAIGPNAAAIKHGAKRHSAHVVVLAFQRFAKNLGLCPKWPQKSRWLPLGALKAPGGLWCHTATCKAAPAHRGHPMHFKTWPGPRCAGAAPVPPAGARAVGPADVGAACLGCWKGPRGPTAAIARRPPPSHHVCRAP